MISNSSAVIWGTVLPSQQWLWSSSWTVYCCCSWQLCARIRFSDKLHAACAMDMCLLVAKGIIDFPSSVFKLTGFIDVYWIVQDGGLCLLIAYLLKQHKVHSIVLLLRSVRSYAHYLVGLARMQTTNHCHCTRKRQQSEDADWTSAVRLSAENRREDFSTS